MIVSYMGKTLPNESITAQVTLATFAFVAHNLPSHHECQAIFLFYNYINKIELHLEGHQLEMDTGG